MTKRKIPRIWQPPWFAARKIQSHFWSTVPSWRCRCWRHVVLSLYQCCVCFKLHTHDTAGCPAECTTGFNV